MNEDQKIKGSARIEIVPFPSADRGSAPPDATDQFVEERENGEHGEVDSSPTRSKQATGWAASGLAGALRRSSRRRGTDL